MYVFPKYLETSSTLPLLNITFNTAFSKSITVLTFFSLYLHLIILDLGIISGTGLFVYLLIIL